MEIPTTVVGLYLVPWAIFCTPTTPLDHTGRLHGILDRQAQALVLASDGNGRRRIFLIFRDNLIYAPWPQVRTSRAQFHTLSSTIPSPLFGSSAIVVHQFPDCLAGKLFSFFFPPFFFYTHTAAGNEVACTLSLTFQRDFLAAYS